jgi:acetylornithine deacetylase/succinyl-diaminopimelate desuccinylase-like protein
MLALVAAYVLVVGRLEARRSAPHLPNLGTPAAAVLAGREHLLADVRTLSSPAFGGRLTGTPGNAAAQAYLTERLTALGVRPFGAAYAQPFAFTRRSVRALLTPGQRYVTDFPAAVNLIGFIPGTRAPGRYLVLSAHYDHLGVRSGRLYPGADDNASGVAVVLAAAAWLREHPPAHSVILALFDGEEEGLRGARQFVAHPPVPLAQLALDVNLDMVSHNDQGDIFVAGTYQHPELRTWLAQAAARSAVKVHLGHDRPQALAGGVEDWTHSSDHGPFHDAGLPFLYFGVEDHADYHQPGDTFEHINQAFFGQVADLVLDTVHVLDQHLDTLAQP